MERGQQRFAFAALPPESVVIGAVDALQEKLRAPDCQLATEIAPNLPRVHADADALGTVLINLLDNACKYTPGEKRIGLRAFAENGHVAFEVSDNGIGIAPDETQRIFERFYQVDQSLTRQRGGCGLGLSIVKFIVTAHRGSVDVRSEAGKGSTFRIRIPIAPSA
jgi:signal transduction histidine kinase